MRRSLAILAAAASLAGCSVFANVGPVPYPDGCASLGLSPRRCAAIVARAREEASSAVRAATASVTLLGPDAGTGNHESRQVARVVFHLADGTSVVQPIVCVGVPGGPQLAIPGQFVVDVINTSFKAISIGDAGLDHAYAGALNQFFGTEASVMMTGHA